MCMESGCGLLSCGEWVWFIVMWRVGVVYCHVESGCGLLSCGEWVWFIVYCHVIRMASSIGPCHVTKRLSCD